MTEWEKLKRWYFGNPLTERDIRFSRWIFYVTIPVTLFLMIDSRGSAPVFWISTAYLTYGVLSLLWLEFHAIPLSRRIRQQNRDL